MELGKLKELLGISGDAQDAVLGFIIADVEETVKNYCNLGELPGGLAHTAYRMAVDLYRNESLGQEGRAPGSVASISAGDTSTSFREHADESFKDTVLKNYKASLNRYRKVGFS